MKKANSKIAAVMVLILLFAGCFTIEEVDQPASASGAAAIDIVLTVSTAEADANAKTGILGLMLPDDWTVTGVAYDYDLGSGTFELLEADSSDFWYSEGGLNTGAEWEAKIDELYASNTGMHWEVWESVEAYAPADTNPKYADITISVTVGTTAGTFNLGYLFSDASEDLTNDGDHDVSLDNAIEVTTVSIAEEVMAPAQYTLSQNYPNPFNPETVIEYTVEQAGDVKLNVYDITGRLVSTLVDAVQSADHYSVVFRADGLPSGTYFYRLTTGNLVETRKMVLLQ